MILYLYLSVCAVGVLLRITKPAESQSRAQETILMDP